MVNDKVKAFIHAYYKTPRCYDCGGLSSFQHFASVIRKHAGEDAERIIATIAGEVCVCRKWNDTIAQWEHHEGINAVAPSVYDTARRLLSRSRY